MPNVYCFIHFIKIKCWGYDRDMKMLNNPAVISVFTFDDSILIISG